MNNSLLLRSAAGLCVINVLFAVLSAWSLSSTRSRLNEGLQQADRAVADLAAKSAKEMTTFKDAMSGTEKRVEAVEKETTALRAKVFPPPKAAKRFSNPTDEDDAPSSDTKP